MTRIVGLDLSLTGTGIATVDNAPVCPSCGGTVTTSGDRHPPRCIRAVCRYEGPGDTAHRVAVSRVTSKGPARRKGDPPVPLSSRSVRLRRLAQQITQECAGADLVVVEGPSYASEGAGTWDRAGLWWLVVGRLTGAGLPVVEVPPSNVKMYALGKGNGASTGKDEVLAAVIRRYLPVVEVPGNNEADALVLAAMGARFTGAPIEPGGDLPAANLRAMTTVRWTT